MLSTNQRNTVILTHTRIPEEPNHLHRRQVPEAKQTFPQTCCSSVQEGLVPMCISFLISVVSLNKRSWLVSDMEVKAALWPLKIQPRVVLQFIQSSNQPLTGMAPASCKVILDSHLHSCAARLFQSGLCDSMPHYLVPVKFIPLPSLTSWFLCCLF